MRSKKKKKLTNNFEIVSEGNEVFLVKEFTEYFETMPNEWTEGLKILITKEGYHVNIEENNIFHIVELGLKCRKKTDN
ncbi:MAG: hypothetical protein KAT68_13450 [Bacteroidales bacterium]|nr:hypothetical protein [Bacteroidales bacterium]